MKKIVILLMLFLGPLSARAFIDDYMSPQDLVLTFSQKFDGLTANSSGCQFVTDSSRQTLGDSNPATGGVTANDPSSAFLKWVDDCVDGYMGTLSYYSPSNGTDPSEAGLDQTIIRNLNIWNNQLVPDLFAPLLARIDLERARFTGGSKTRTEFLLYTFPTSDQERRALVANLVEWFLGSDDEIISYGRMTDVDQFRADLAKMILNETDLRTAATRVIKVLVKRDEFLMY